VDIRSSPSHHYEAEHFVYLHDGRLYELCGLAPLDRAREIETRLLRRIDELPTEPNARLAAE
jgi:hypothetical protein